MSIITGEGSSNKNLLSDFKQKFHQFVDEANTESDDNESLEPGELKSPDRPADTKRIRENMVNLKSMGKSVEKRSQPPPPPPTPAVPVQPSAIVGGSTEKCMLPYMGTALIYKICPGSAVSSTPSLSEQNAAKRKREELQKEEDTKKLEEERRRRRSPSNAFIRGKGGFIRRPFYQPIHLNARGARGGRGGFRGGRGGMPPQRRFRPATAEDRERGREEKKRRKMERKSRDQMEMPHVLWTNTFPSISYAFNPAYQKVKPNKDGTAEKKKKKKKKKKKDDKPKSKKSRRKKLKRKLLKIAEKTEKSSTPKIETPVVICIQDEADAPPPSSRISITEIHINSEADSDDSEGLTPSPPELPEETEIEILESFPIAKETGGEVGESPDTDEYVDNWENEETSATTETSRRIDEEMADGFRTPIYVNPSPPPDHKPLPSAEEQQQQQETTVMQRHVVDDTAVIKPRGKVLFGMNDIYSDILKNISQDKHVRKLSPPSSSSASSSDDDESSSSSSSSSSSEEPQDACKYDYDKFSVEDRQKIKKLDDNLIKIQSMKTSFYESNDEFSEGLNKMEKFLETERNIILKKYTAKPQFLVTLQETDIEKESSPQMFQTSIKMVISPSKLPKSKIATGNLLASDDEESTAVRVLMDQPAINQNQVPEFVVHSIKREKTPPPAQPAAPTQQPPQSTLTTQQKDVKKEKPDERRSAGKRHSKSPPRRRRSRTPPKSGAKKVVKHRSPSPSRRHHQNSHSPSRRSSHHTSRRGGGGRRSHSRSFSPRSKVRRRTRSRSPYSRSPLPFKPPSPPPMLTPSDTYSNRSTPQSIDSTDYMKGYYNHQHHQQQPPPPLPYYHQGQATMMPYNDMQMQYNGYSNYGYMSMPTQNIYAPPMAVATMVPPPPVHTIPQIPNLDEANLNLCDYGPQSHFNQDQSVIKELPKAQSPALIKIEPVVVTHRNEIAIQKGNVLEIIPKAFPAIPAAAIVKQEPPCSPAAISPIIKVNLKSKPKPVSLSVKRKEVETRSKTTNELRLRGEVVPKIGILRREKVIFSSTSLSSEEETDVKVEGGRSSAKKPKKTVLFEDGIKPKEDSEEEDRVDIEFKVRRKLKQLKKKYDNEIQIKKEKLEDSDSEWDNLPPPPPPEGSPPPHLEQPIYIRPESPPVFTYLLYDPVVNALYTANDENAPPPRLLYSKDNGVPSPNTSTTSPPCQSGPKGSSNGGIKHITSSPLKSFILEGNSNSPLACGSPVLNMNLQQKHRSSPLQQQQPPFFPQKMVFPSIPPMIFGKPPPMGGPPASTGNIPPFQMNPFPNGMPPQFCAYNQPPPPTTTNDMMMFQSMQLPISYAPPLPLPTPSISPPAPPLKTHRKNRFSDR